MISLPLFCIIALWSKAPFYFPICTVILFKLENTYWKQFKQCKRLTSK